MTTLEQFKRMIEKLDSDVLGALCEQFIYDHEGAISATIEFAEEFGLTIQKQQATDFITSMHGNGDFDEVECWGMKLGSNALYKKFHP